MDHARKLGKPIGCRSVLARAGVCALLAACSGDPQVERPPQTEAATPKHIPEGPDDLPVPRKGFQVRSVGAEIGPGEDIEYCEIGELPGDPSETYFVKSIELANAAFSHHLVVSAAVPGSAADATLRALNVGDRVKCNGANYEWPDEGLVGLLSAQTPYIGRDFPEGVGINLYGNQRLVFDYHYVNSSAETIRAASAFNAHTADEASIQHIATAFSFFNFTVDIPARSAKSFIAECHFKDDLTLSGLVRHTHQQGRDFSVWFSGGPQDGEHIWTSHDWKHEPGYDFPEPILMKAGDGFRYECGFENPTDSPLRYGIKGSDEMCILAGWIWPAGDAKQVPPQDCGVTWVDGEGLGHPATEAGGFPPASAADANLCLAGINLLGLGGTPECASCMCNSCGSVLLKCATDPDCGALISCLGQGCSNQSECIQSCEDQIHQHSSAIGMMQQVQGCLASRCAECGVWGP